MEDIIQNSDEIQNDEKEEEEEETRKTTPQSDKWNSYVALFVYTLLNVYTYFTRYIPSILKDFIADDLKLSDVQTGFLFTAFITCYMIVSPLVGLLTDKQLISRRFVAISGVVLFSLSTAAAGFCKTYGLLVTARIFFGAGEAAYVTVSAPILCDYFPPQKRNVVMGVFLGATPIGCALGYLIAGTVGTIVGWRKTFVYLAIPGLFVFSLLFLKEPKLGAFDNINKEEDDDESSIKREDDSFGKEDREIGYDADSYDNEINASDGDYDDNDSDNVKLINHKPQNVHRNKNNATVNTRGIKSKLRDLACEIKENAKVLCNAPYMVAVGGYIADTFGMGGFSDWLPTFFVRYYGLSVWEAGLTNGIIIVMCGCLGTLAGSFLADYVKERVTKRHPYLLVSGLSMLACSVVCVLGLYLLTSSKAYIEVMLSIGLLLGWFCNGPVNAIILNSVPPSHRSSANGLSVLLIHLFGDAISPSIIGLISDSTNNNLRMSLLLIPLSLLVSAFVWLGGWIVIPRNYHNLNILT